MTFLQGTISGIPVWVWIIAGGAVVVGIVWWMRRQQSGTTGSGVLGQNTTATATPDPNIDPYTGVPYSIEEATNPATGLPAYYGGPGVDQNLNGLTGPTPSVQQPAPPAPTLVPGLGRYPNDPTHPFPPAPVVQQPPATPQLSQPGPLASDNPSGIGQDVTVTQQGQTLLSLSNGDPTLAGYALNYNRSFLQQSAQAFGQPGTITTQTPLNVGQTIYLPYRPGPAMGRAVGSGGPYQATPFWPDMTDLYGGRH